jgi:membrane associated rhomboid family serine protease
MSYPSQPPAPEPQAAATCYRHPDRRAGVRCQRCEKPICPSCMNQASVGFQCPDCVQQGARKAPVYSARTLPGDRPLATFVLIGLNVVAFVAQLATIGRNQSIVWGMAGEVGVDGWLYGPAVGAGEWWRLLTSGFLHGGLLHIGMNMYVLYMIGPQIEKLLGSARFVALYVSALLAGSLGVMLLAPYDETLGASGAIFGLLGAAAAFQLANRINIWQSGLGSLILINVAITFFGSAFISVGGHLGGLVGGAAVGYALFLLDKRGAPALAGVAVATAAAAVFVVIALAVAPMGGYFPS